MCSAYLDMKRLLALSANIIRRFRTADRMMTPENILMSNTKQNKGRIHSPIARRYDNSCPSSYTPTPVKQTVKKYLIGRLTNGVVRSPVLYAHSTAKGRLSTL